MLEEELYGLLAWIEKAGLWLSVLAWLTVAAGATVMAYVLRRERRRAIWLVVVIVGAVALAANLADYVVTLFRSPDLSLEANPLWSIVVDRWGLGPAKLYGLTGKFLVSILAGQMFGFYLSNRERLFPARAGSVPEFLRQMGNRSRNPRERLAALFTLFAFFFAGIQLLYFYIAYLNWVEEPDLLIHLPSVPAAILILIISLSIAFVAITYRAFATARAGGWWKSQVS